MYIKKKIKKRVGERIAGQPSNLPELFQYASKISTKQHNNQFSMLILHEIHKTQLINKYQKATSNLFIQLSTKNQDYKFIKEFSNLKQLLKSLMQFAQLQLFK
eukprot:TRINITY_DN65414_c0_g1_i1.p4 TRINITY_DN65414_c0_g1~~TRINITY_DN65414_c0_g1_i1.p4  ORF type:complete len:103 (-),score=0.13 TRINITY_DN65414_c0_g1_i1:341-649(-)